MLEWALRYIKLGWPVIPLRGKLPLTEHGSTDATLNESQVREWWAKWPNANIGVATGHRFFVVDVDVAEGGEDSWEMLRAHHGVPDTIEQITGTGGKHVLYLLPDFPVKNSVKGSESKLGRGIHIRGQGGYIVASPSIHPETGNPYYWDGMKEIEQQQISAAPKWLLAKLQEVDRVKPAQSTPDKIIEGGRNDTLFRSGARLRRMGWSEEEIFASLAVINRTRCQPPLPDDELHTIAKSAARYEPHAGANVFRKRLPPPPYELTSPPVAAAPPSEPEELPLTSTDIEAAADAAIAKDDLLAAMALAENVAKLLPLSQVLIETKLRLHFGDKFRSADFRRAMKPGNLVEMPARVAIEEGEEDVATLLDRGKLLSQPLTDSGNGERIVALFGSEIRYCIEMQKWLVWDGKRWAVDERQMATQRAKQMARLLYAQGTGKSSYENWARKSESQAGISAALKRASTELGIPISAAELDQHPYLLNCLNGVVDLRTGTLLPHDKAYLVTKMCHVNYAPQAECARFKKFIGWAMGDNPEAEMTERTTRLIAFLQRLFGYALTADVSEKAAFVFYGPKGNNGKTTLLTTFRTLLSEYAAQISIDTLMTRTQDAALRADMADLRGARLVTTSEVNEGQRLSEATLKYITAGMGYIKSCRKYENPIEFVATHKLIMDCNHRPAVRGADDAIWRRLKPVEFNVSIAEDDPDFDNKLIEKLVAESEGILAWAVRGSVKWMEEGLGDPPEVSQANLAWREHDDPLKEFIEDCCEIGEDLWIRSAELSEAYAWWCKQNRERFPLGRQHFGERIRGRGFEPSRSRRTSDDKQMRTFEGLKVRDEISRQIAAEGKSYQSLLAD